DEVNERELKPGVSVGLVWTPVGGDIIFIETAAMPGRGELLLTGQLGDVMKESARAALSYLRMNAQRLGIDPDLFQKTDIHVHVPAGAIPKDGPSAGVTILTAMTSLFTGRSVRPRLAMTGEITLTGQVLPVGGIKEKVLAAHRAGIHKILLPARNEKDLKEEVPEIVQKDLEVQFVSEASEVLVAAFEQPAKRPARKK
ncbi:MAG: S16 family serine protease, partial [Fimbriimonadales bacterium]